MGSKKSQIAKGKQVVAEDFEIADSFFSRMRGLMFRSKPKAILFKFDYSARHSIHSLFVFFPFDAVYLDEMKKIVSLHSGIKPFTLLVTPAAPARYLLELPAGAIARNRLKLGESLSFDVRDV